MGAWGEGTLENDAALDWLGDLTEHPQIQTITIALSEAANETDYLDADLGSEALVAAELVAYALGHAPKAPDERLTALAAELDGLRDYQDLATQAVTVVADPERSELFDLWTEDGPNEDWDLVLADLLARLR
jgi:hypothetical protein